MHHRSLAPGGIRHRRSNEFPETIVSEPVDQLHWE